MVNPKASANDGALLTQHLLSAEQIETLSVDERRELIHRLQRPLHESMNVPPAERVRRIRRNRLIILVASAVGLIPWIFYLATSLPRTYDAHHWAYTWVGFDAILVLSLGLTAIFGWYRSQLLVLTSFASGVLLICDAWFDLMTATPGDRFGSLLSAVFAEIPLALLLIATAMRIIRVAALRMWLIEPDQRIWRIRIPVN